MMRMPTQGLRRIPQNAKRFIAPGSQVAFLSTAPMRKQTLSISYEEWMAEKTASAPQTPVPKRPFMYPTLSRRKPPQKHNSLVLIPDTAHLKWSPESRGGFQLKTEEFGIAKPGKGGHVVLGPNGSGKSLLVRYLAQPVGSTAEGEDWKVPLPHEIAHVSFDSHLKLLQEHPHRTVHESITGGTGNLSKAAQYLVVRFGLYPLLRRTVSTLSTGEIRKCMLVSALAKQPKLLVLENAFDGLDVDSRKELQSIVSKTIQGLSNSGRLLVQSVQADYVPPAQVLISTHRPEEILPEISTVSWIAPTGPEEGTLVTAPRPRDYSQDQLMYMALGLDKDHNKCQQNWSTLAPWEQEDPSLPSLEDIRTVWPSSDHPTDNHIPRVALTSVMIRRHRDGISPEDDGSGSELATLLHPLSWIVEKGERWLVAGGNGAGKSTLTRFLLKQQQKTADDKADESSSSSTQDLISGLCFQDDATKIGWVSTESHLSQVARDGSATTSAWDYICDNNDGLSPAETEKIVQWVFGDDTNKNVRRMLQDRSLDELSQGEQKMALIATALAKRPNLLVLDEPLQGLDWVHRRRILALLERICQAQVNLSLIYITHYPEEYIPAISHILHLDHGRALYQGERKYYNASKL